jgi:hypothetical protein
MRTETNIHTSFRGYFRRRLPVLLAVGIAAAVSAPAALAGGPAAAPPSFWSRALDLLVGSDATADLTRPDERVLEAAKKAAPAKKPAQPTTAKKAKPKAAAPKPKKKAQPQPKPANGKSAQLQWVTGSRYEQTTNVNVLREQGCRAGKRQQNGLVILAFGKPAYDGHSYGTILFSNTFAPNVKIVRATKAYANGYAACLPEGSPAQITLARGTSNYHPSVPSAYKAGRKWARDTMTIAKYLRNHPGVGAHVTSAAAIDAEPAWDPSFHQTHHFFRGFRDARTGYLLYNFGSLDGGVGSIWNLRQAFYVSGGMKDARVVPEIYFKEQAKQWAELARLAQKRYGRSVQFAGIMTQHSAGCGNCGMTALKAHRTLKKELARHDVTRDLARTLASATNIN